MQFLHGASHTHINFVVRIRPIQSFISAALNSPCPIQYFNASSDIITSFFSVSNSTIVHLTRLLMAPREPNQEYECPKLGRFLPDLMADDVEFIEILDCQSAHGKVVKMRMKNRLYAIKFVSQHLVYKRGKISSEH